MIHLLLAIASCPRLPDRVRDDAGLVAAVMKRGMRKEGRHG